jgi:hypothetical protein
MTSVCVGCWGAAGGVRAPAVLRLTATPGFRMAQAPAAAFPGVRWLRGSRPSAPRGQYAAPLPRLVSSCQEHLEGDPCRAILDARGGCGGTAAHHCTGSRPDMGHLAYIGGLLVPLLILLAFAMGHLLGKHRARR